MNQFLRALLVRTIVVLLVAGSRGSGQSTPLTIDLDDSHVDVGWNTSRGGFSLKWSGDLGATQPWTASSRPSLIDGDRWEVRFPLNQPQRFFRLEPSPIPPAPPGFRLTTRNGIFILDWLTTPEAEFYTVYVGTGPTVGPSNFVATYPLSLSNHLEIGNLMASQAYFLTVTASNAAGESPRATVVSGIFGPASTVSGYAVCSYPLAAGRDHEVLASNAIITLLNTMNPAWTYVDTTDCFGKFSFTDIPVGEYTVSYEWNGRSGSLAAPLQVPEEGATISPLELDFGPPVPSTSDTVVGRVVVPSGRAALLDLAEFGIHVRAQVTVQTGLGQVFPVEVDCRGGFGFQDPGLAYPLTVTASYKDLTPAVAIVPAPLQEIVPLELRFVDPVPTVTRITAMQQGREALRIVSGEPVTFVAEINNPAGLALEPHWIAEFNGQVQLSTEASPTFTFVQPAGPDGPGNGDPLDSGMATVRFYPACFPPEFKAVRPVESIAGVLTPCWSGTACIWDPDSPDDLASAHPADITLKTSLALPHTTTTSRDNGYFELPVNPTAFSPYRVKIEKEGHVPFIWPFEHRLPREADFCVIPIRTFHVAPGGGGNIRILDHPSGATLIMLSDSLVDPVSGLPYSGTVVVKMAAFNAAEAYPWPPNAQGFDGADRFGVYPLGAAWVSLESLAGVPLTYGSGVTLVLPCGTAGPVVSPLDGFRQDQTSGYFDRTGFSGTDATWVSGNLFKIPIDSDGLYVIGHHSEDVNELAFVADRSLNYPFDLRINGSIFPVSVRSEFNHDFGHLYVPTGYGQRLRVLDLRQAPGRKFADPSDPSSLITPRRKVHIIEKSVTPNEGPALPPDIPTLAVSLSLGENVPELKFSDSDTVVSIVEGADQFLSRASNDVSAALDYYDQINAPGTLAEWRELNGLPERLGGNLPGVAAEDYATAYLYNLGDLGFARAHTMRIRTSGVDGETDAAFAVTNYQTLEDARCGVGAVATVCMDFAARADKGKVDKDRYTRFYAYGSDGGLLTSADLDGAGAKAIPNLCVTCHGGKKFAEGDSPNLGSRFLPFDLEAYSFHPKFDVQLGALAKLNAGVLKTEPSGAISNLIRGWYGGVSDPNTSPGIYDQDFVPVGWAGQPGLYTDVFKASCRVCHISRDVSGVAQFNSFVNFARLDYGGAAACSSLDMPHAQRTWGIFWGSRAAKKLGYVLPDMPEIIGTESEKVDGCPSF